MEGADGREPAARQGSQAWSLADMQSRARGQAAWLEVAEVYRALLRDAPDDYRLLGNLGNALWVADQPSLALDPYRQALLSAPDEAILYRGLGNVLTDLQSYEAADRAYRRSRDLDDSPITAWNHSQVLMGLENYGEAYALAERRWELAEPTPWRDPLSAWRGEPEGWSKPLLVWSEQGLGDTLQHLRWLGPLLSRRATEGGAPLVVEVEECLVELLRQALVRDWPNTQVIAKAKDGASFWPGNHISLLSLPILLGEAPCPAQAFHLHCPSWSASQARSRVGLVWAAGQKLESAVTAREYERRSLDQGALEPLLTGLGAAGLTIVLLQFGPDARTADPWLPADVERLPQGADFAETAQLVATLDLVITVDTAMAHLVGAMERPGWVLLPFSAAPRWLRHRTDSPWYSSLRLFRQSRPGDWAEPVEALLNALRQRLSKDPSAIQ